MRAHQKLNIWREGFNPLRGLSLARVTVMLDAGERGDYADLQWFYQQMERSEPMIFAVIQRRLAALLSVEWDIHTLEQSDDKLFDPIAVGIGH